MVAVNCEWRLYSFQGEISVTMCIPVEYENKFEYHQRSNDQKERENWLVEVYQRYTIKSGEAEYPFQELIEISKYHIWQIETCSQDNSLDNSVHRQEFGDLFVAEWGFEDH